MVIIGRNQKKLRVILKLIYYNNFKQLHTYKILGWRRFYT